MKGNLPQLRTAFSSLLARNESTGVLSYPRYSARAILVTTINAGTPINVIDLISNLVYRGQTSSKKQPYLFGNTFVLGSFVIIHLEGDHDTLVEFFKTIQPHVLRWPGLEPHHPITLALKRKADKLRAAGQTPASTLLGHCAVLLYEEDISLQSNNWHVAVLPTLPEGDSDPGISMFTVVNHTVATILKCATITQLIGPEEHDVVIPGTCLSAIPSQVLIKLFFELPTYTFLKRIVLAAQNMSYPNMLLSGMPQKDLKIEPHTPLDQESLESWQVYSGNLKIDNSAFFINSIVGDALEQLGTINEKHRQFLAESNTIFSSDAITGPDGEPINDLFSLDEFIIDFVYTTPETLFEDMTYSMNEDWCFENLHHSLHKAPT